ncbi:MAG: GTPase ObgE [Chloroflexota bacterium]|nr:GTPase ObgE [Chloroflexota bacterium]
MFTDRARIHVAAGHGGDGASSFRREAHVPRGGPDGGDGGRGGSVVLVALRELSSLNDFQRTRHFRAGPGGRGAGRRAHGRNAPDVVLGVPPGTVVRDADGGWLGDLVEPGNRLIVARGGRGGRGNIHFATPTHRAPRHAEKGEPGEERWIELELKLIADIGLVGAPNAGKSTLLAALTDATPSVAAYPFTTLAPNLGVMEFDDDRRAVLADVPGLIEGASDGAGLGHEFLRHVERTRVLVGVVNGDALDPVDEWRHVWREILAHDPALAARPSVVAYTKMDLESARERWPSVRAALRRDGTEPIAVSAHDGHGLDALGAAIRAALDAADADTAAAPVSPEMRVHRFDPLAEGFEVIAEGDALRVRGRRIERVAARTNFDNVESRDRFQRHLERSGIDAELRRRGATNGTTVRIGPAELEWSDE